MSGRGQAEGALALLRLTAERALTGHGGLEPVDAAVLGSGDSKLVAWAPRLTHAGLLRRLAQGVLGSHTDLEGNEHPIYLWQEEGWTGAPDIACNGTTAWLQNLGYSGGGFSVTEALPPADVRAIAAHRPAARAWTAALSDTGSPTLVTLLAHYAGSREALLAVSTKPVRDSILRQVADVEPHERSWTPRLEHLCRYATSALQTMSEAQRGTVEALAVDGWLILAAIDVALTLGDG